MTTNNPRTVLAKLTACEVDGGLAPDARRVLLDERFALDHAIKSGTPEKIQSATTEAVRVMEMWGVK